jgi:hypothetical protein
VNLAILVPELAALVDGDGLPPTLTAQQIARLYGVGADHVYSEVRAGTWPTPVITLGRARRFPTVPALEALGLWPLDQEARSRHPSAGDDRPFLAVVTS